MIYLKEIPHKLKIYLYANKISQRELSKKIKINHTTFNLFLNGRYNLDEKEIKRLCEAVNLNYDSFLNNKIEELK